MTSGSETASHSSVKSVDLCTQPSLLLLSLGDARFVSAPEVLRFEGELCFVGESEAGRSGGGNSDGCWRVETILGRGGGERWN